MKLTSPLSRDLWVAIGAFFLLFATAATFNIPTPDSGNMTFGWEYGNIAEAMVQGKGFANPFQLESGPTAWMPPIFVFFLAGTFSFFGIKSVTAMWVILIIKYIAMAVCVYFLLIIANHSEYRKYKYVLVPLFLVLIFINLGIYFKSIHDEWLVLFLTCSIIFTFTNRIYKPSRTNTVYLYILAIVLPLANPILALSFAVVEVGIFLWHKPESFPKFRWLQTLTVFGLLATSTLLWTYRNYEEFGVFIPIKSNFWFDFYQANALDEDGLVTNSTFVKYHPNFKNSFQNKYLIEKEVQFLQEFKDLLLEWIRTNPSLLPRNIGRRAISAFIYMHAVEDTEPVKRGLLSPKDIEKLTHEKLIAIDEESIPRWISLTMPQSEFERQIHAMELSDEDAILQNWSRRRQALTHRLNDPRTIIKSFLMAFIPTFCLICGFVIEKIRKKPIFLIAGAMYLTYLGPYILASYYRRYQVPLIGLQSIFIFFFICILLEKFLPRALPCLKFRSL
jgi:hypothetical protein